MPGEYFGKILKEKKGQKKGTELFLNLVELTEEAFEKFEDAVKVWRSGDYERGYELRDEIIKMERDADEIKDIFFKTIFTRKSYLPQITEERYNMMLNADHVMDRIERAVRVLCLKKIDNSYFPPEFDQILDKTDKVMELFVKSNEYFFENYEKSSKAARKLEVVRDEVRDLYFIIQGKCVNDELPRGTERVLNVTTRISITAEEGTDYLKVLMAKHS
ncbi:MAG: DUF47 family protein [Candidatus Hodarchaeales archaeon]|jgi:uncharacterized protein Yka (UPF0111/DUF47 family)